MRITRGKRLLRRVPMRCSTPKVIWVGNDRAQSRTLDQYSAKSRLTYQFSPAFNIQDYAPRRRIRRELGQRRGRGRTIDNASSKQLESTAILPGCPMPAIHNCAHCGHARWIHQLPSRDGSKPRPCRRLACTCENYLPPKRQSQRTNESENRPSLKPESSSAE